MIGVVVQVNDNAFLYFSVRSRVRARVLLLAAEKGLRVFHLRSSKVLVRKEPWGCGASVGRGQRMSLLGVRRFPPRAKQMDRNKRDERK